MVEADWRLDPELRLERKNAFDASLTLGTACFNRESGRLKRGAANPFAWAVEAASGLIKAELSEIRACPLCDAHMAEELFVKDGFPHVRCLGCGLIYVSRVLRPEIMERYWRDESQWTAVLNSEPQMRLDSLKFIYGLELASARLGGCRLLDVGSGPGGFVRLAADRGWESLALELNAESARRMRAEGLRVIDHSLSEISLPDASFDLISFWEVLEHLPRPLEILRQASRLLAPEGLALIVVPNVSSLVTRLLHEKSGTFGGHSHVNHFSPDTLTALVERAGLQIVEMETIITELGTINNHLAFEDPYGGQAPAFCPELSPKLIHQRLWGSRLLVLAGLKRV